MILGVHNDVRSPRQGSQYLISVCAPVDTILDVG